MRASPASLGVNPDPNSNAIGCDRSLIQRPNLTGSKRSRLPGSNTQEPACSAILDARRKIALKLVGSRSPSQGGSRQRRQHFQALAGPDFGKIVVSRA
jgi:hypothetical protein